MVSGQVQMSFEDRVARQRVQLVDHMVNLRRVDVEYARYALGVIERTPHSPFADIRQDVLDAWEKSKQKGGE